MWLICLRAYWTGGRFIYNTRTSRRARQGSAYDLPRAEFGHTGTTSYMHHSALCGSITRKLQNIQP